MKRALGAFETSQLIADRYSPFHVVGVLRLENAPPPYIVRRSLGILQGRHPFLSARLLHEKGRDYLAQLVNPALPFHHHPRWNDEHWKQVVEMELASRIDITNGPMFRCTYLYSESHPQAELILTISHVISDAASISHLMHEWMTLCASFLEERSIHDLKHSPAPTLESRYPANFRGWRMKLHMLRYAFSQMSDEISYRLQTRGKRTPQVPARASLGHVLTLQFDEDFIERFAQRARKEGVTLNSALNAVLLLSVDRHLYDGQQLPMRTFSFADLRPYTQPRLDAEDLGCYISMMRYTVPVQGDIDFWSLARDLHNRIYTSLKSGDKFVAAVMAEALMKMITRVKTIRLSASALNYSGIVPIRTSYGSIKVTEVHGFVPAYGIGPEIAAQAQMFNGKLFWDLIYMEADMSHEKAKAISEEITSIIRAAVGKSDPYGSLL